MHYLSLVGCHCKSALSFGHWNSVPKLHNTEGAVSSLRTDKLSDLARGAATEGWRGWGEVKRKRGVEVLVKRSRDPGGSKDKVREPG